MSLLKLILKNLVFFRKSHAGLLAAVMLTSSVITGALVTGDSVQHTLRSINEKRIGQAQLHISTAQSWIGLETAGIIEDKLNSESPMRVIPAVMTSGIALDPDTDIRVSPVQILGIDEQYRHLGLTQGGDFFLKDGEALVNQSLASALRIKTGDEILLKFTPRSPVPHDNLFSSDQQKFSGLRVRIRGILTDGEGGAYSTNASQSIPYNVFVSITELGSLLDAHGLINTLIITGPNANLSMVEKVLQESLTLKDYGFRLRPSADQKHYQLDSERIFIEDGFKTFLSGLNWSPYFSYLINSFQHGINSTPYSFMAGIDESFSGTALEDDQVIINQWLSDDLNAKLGDTIRIHYYADDSILTEESAQLTVHSVIPMDHPLNQTDYLFNYRGFAFESCLEWDTGIPINLKRIRPKDELYWDDYRGTPKAFLPITAARSLWASRFGTQTGILFDAEGLTISELEETLRKRLEPDFFGFRILKLQDAASRAGSGTVDFGSLFAALSFFVLISALVLIFLFVSLSSENRRAEIGLLLSLGFRPSSINFLFIAETGVIALLAALAGLPASVLYSRGILFGLKTVWADAVGTSALTLDIRPSTLLVGFLTTVILSVLTAALSVVRSVKTPVHILQKKTPVQPSGFFSTKVSPFVSAAFLITAVILILSSLVFKKGDPVLVFSVSGFLLLFSLLTGFLRFFSIRNQGLKISLIGLIADGIRWNRKRSLTTAFLMAVASFIVLAVGLNRIDAPTDPHRKDSGTGGYSIYYESSIPVSADLEDENILIHSLKLQDGEDASCLNLNRVSRYRIAGVPSGIFQTPSRFKLSDGMSWNDLEADRDDLLIPVAIDESVALWSLGINTGDTLEITAENGEPVTLILTSMLSNSIFQGTILMSQKHFNRIFPSSSGSRILLFEVSSGLTEDIMESIQESFQDYGGLPETTRDRLNRFNAVQNTYLMIFLFLGGMGILLGLIGAVVLAFKNWKERESEFFILKALGFPKELRRFLFIAEYFLVIVTGLTAGGLAAFLAVWPV